MSIINRDDAIAIAMHSKDPVDGIKNLPAVDAVEVVHGRWIPRYEIKEMYYSPDDIEQYKVPYGFSCSVCDKWISARTNYCPNCGAKMDGE